MTGKELDDLAAAIVLGQENCTTERDLGEGVWRDLIRRIDAICERAAFASVYLELTTVAGVTQESAARRAQRAARLVRSALGYSLP